MSDGVKIRRSSAVLRLWPDGLAILAITAAVALVSQRWAGLDTPDSSFYTTLAVFGHDVTDRAIDASYFWARLGQVAPTMGLTHLLGPWLGFAVYRLLLLLAIVTSAYTVLRRFTPLWPTCLLTSFIVTSTVVLSYLGNPYLTGSVLAGTCILIAVSLSDRPAASITAGATIGWLLMVNPSGMILASVIWFTIRASRTRPGDLRRSLLLLVITAFSAVAVFIAFILIGQQLFPALDWFSTYRTALTMNLSDFASTDPVWLQDISLLVPLALLVVVTAAWFMRRDSVPAGLAVIIAWSSVVGLLLVSWLMHGIALEAPFYQAMIWPPLLLALGLTTTAVVADGRWSIAAALAGALGVVLIVVAGHWPGALAFTSGLILAALLIVAAVSGLLATRATTSAVWAVVGVSLVLIGAQLLQNSRGPMGLYYLSPYNWAYNANPVSDKLHTAVNTEQWVLDHTTSDDRMLVWVGGDWAGGDRQLYVVAGMQLWGPNLLSLEPTMTDVFLPQLNDRKPTVLELIAPSMDQVLAMWQSLPQRNRPSAPQCYDFTWPVEPSVGHACLTTLTWDD